MDAHSLLEGMPPGENGKMAVLPPAGGGGGVLEHIVGFLPAPDAVRTCVLAWRWRHLWKSATGLRVDCRDDEGRPAPVKEHREFVDQLFLVRRGLPLDTCELTLGEFEDNDVPRMNRWIQHAIMCKARVLRIRMLWDWYLELRDMPLVSRHLTRLELLCVRTRTSFLDFSSCPALEHVEFEYCDFSSAKKISSESLKRLSIIDSPFSSKNSCLQIYAPNLVSLHLDDFRGRTPILESMPSLVEAFV